jgi:hypothetical protein
MRRLREECVYPRNELPEMCSSCDPNNLMKRDPLIGTALLEAAV